MADDLKNLPAEERIKRLKELEVKKKKEIEEQQKVIEKEKKEIEDAEKEIKNANEELTERQKVKDKVPILEAASESGEGLSEEAKIILKSMQKRVSGKNENENGEVEESREGKKERTKEQSTQERMRGFSTSALEETVQQERKQMEGQGRGGVSGDYVTSLSQQPAVQLYAQMSTLYQAVETKGYMNSEEQRRVQYISSAMEKKLEDVDAGRYSLTQEAARVTSLTQQMSEVVRGMYKTDSSKKAKELDWYKSG